MTLIIRRKIVGRNLTAREIARLDADALRQRRRRAAKRAEKSRPPPRRRVLAAAMLIGLSGGALAGFGYVRADGASTAQAAPMASQDWTFAERLDAISETLSHIRSDIKEVARKPPAPKPVRTAALPQAPTPAPMPIPKASLEDVRSWTAPSGAWSSVVLKNWAEIVGVDLDWQADIDIQLAVPLQVEGDFENAVTSLLDGLSHTSPRPKGHLHLNRKTGRPALVVAAEGNPDGL